MAAIEGALLLLASAWPLLRMLDWHRRRMVATIYVALAVGAITAMLLSGAGRWPLAPALLLLLIWEVQASSVMVGDIPAPASTRLPTVAYGAVLILLALPASLLPILLLPRVPPIEGSGPYLVGTRTLRLVDSISAVPDEVPPQVHVRLWYPGEPAPDLRPLERPAGLDSLERALAGDLLGRPWGLAVRGVTRAAVHAFAPMRLLTKQREFPVVVLSHPPGNPLLLRRLAVNLASHGFMVVEPLGDEAVPVHPSDAPEVGGAPKGEPIGRRGDALLAGLRAVASVGSGDPLAGRLAVDQVGWVGLGSGVEAGRALAATGEVVALVAIASGEDPPPRIDGPAELRLEQVGAPAAAGGGTIRTAMLGAMPLDFTDLARWSPLLLRWSGRGGFVAAARMEAWIQAWSVTFLGVHLGTLPFDSLRALPPRFPGTAVSFP